MLGVLERAGVEVVGVGVREVVEAAQLFVDAVAARTLGHVDDFRLNDAVTSATERKIGDRFGIARAGADVSPLTAAALAHSCVETRPVLVPRIFGPLVAERPPPTR